MAIENQSLDNRICPDFWCRSIKWLCILGWILLLISMMLFHTGRPLVTTGIERQNIEKVQVAWDPAIAPYFLSSMILIFYIS